MKVVSKVFTACTKIPLQMRVETISINTSAGLCCQVAGKMGLNLNQATVHRSRTATVSVKSQSNPKYQGQRVDRAMNCASTYVPEHLVTKPRDLFAPTDKPRQLKGND